MISTLGGKKEYYKFKKIVSFSPFLIAIFFRVRLSWKVLRWQFGTFALLASLQVSLLVMMDTESTRHQHGATGLRAFTNLQRAGHRSRLVTQLWLDVRPRSTGKFPPCGHVPSALPLLATHSI